MKTAILTLALCTAALSPALSFADEPAAEGAVVRGTVRDAATGKPIPGASVYRQETDEVAVTDDAGHFAFPPGGPKTSHLAVVDPSYQRADVHADGKTSIDIVLTPVSLRGDEVVVETERERATAGQTMLKREELTHIAGVRDAPGAIRSLPGVANTSGFGPNAGLVIRGSSPADSKFFVDGFEIPILYHLGGIQAVIPSEMIDDIVYSPGTFGVEYGKASAGIIEIRSRKGAKDFSGFAEVSFINAQGLLQGPIGDKGSFAVSVRRSYIDGLIALVVPDSSSLSFTTLPRYYDYQARADYELIPHLKLTAFLFGSDDKLAISTDAEDPDDPARGGKFSNTTSFTRAIVSATYDRPGRFNRLAVSALTQKVGFDVGTDRYLRTSDNTIAVRDEARLAIVDGVSLVAGGQVEAHDVDVHVKLPRPPKEGDPTQPNFTYDTIVDQVIQAKPVDAGAWAALEIAPWSWLKTTAGVRIDEFSRNHVTVVEPRVHNRVTISPTTAILAAAGLYTRPPQNQDENLQTDLLPEKSWQSSLGWEEKLAPGVTLTTTAYYNKRSDMIVTAAARDSSDAAMDYYNNDGIGKSYGAELLLQARGERFFGWAAYTYSRSERRDHPMSDWRLFDTDQSHNLILVGSVKLGERKQWQLGGRFQYTTGAPYTPVDGAVFEADKNTYTPVYGATNSLRNGSQHQLDLRVDRTFAFHDWKLAAYLDVSNVYMNAAVVGYQYNSDYTKRTEITNLPILPSFGVRGEF